MRREGISVSKGKKGSRFLKALAVIVLSFLLIFLMYGIISGITIANEYRTPDREEMIEEYRLDTMPNWERDFEPYEGEYYVEGEM